MKAGIRGKMLLGILTPVVVVLMLAGVLISSLVGKYVTELTKEKLAANSLAAANQVSGYFTAFLKEMEQASQDNQSIAVLETLKGDMRANEQAEYAEIKKMMLARAQVEKDAFIAMWLSDFDSSQLFSSDGFISDPGWDVTARPWYKVASAKKPVMTEPYVDASTGAVVVTAAAPIYHSKSGEMIGASGCDIRLDTVQKTINETKIGKTGFLVLMTGNGQILCHPNQDLAQQYVSDIDIDDTIKNAVANGQKGNYVYQMEGRTYYGSLADTGDIGWYVLSAMPEAEADRKSVV